MAELAYGLITIIHMARLA